MAKISTLPGTFILADKDLWIFDFDGVLVDSVDIKTSAFAEIYRPYGAYVEGQVVAHHKENGGMSRFDKFAYYQSEFLGLEVTAEAIQKLSARFSGLVMRSVVMSEEVEGVSDILAYCGQHGFTCAIASATPQDEVRKIVEQRGWTKNFKFIFGAPQSKSNNIKKIMSVTSRTRAKTIFFGDSPNDLIAANECQIDFVPINFLGESDIGFRDFLSSNNI